MILNPFKDTEMGRPITLWQALKVTPKIRLGALKGWFLYKYRKEAYLRQVQNRLNAALYLANLCYSSQPSLLRSTKVRK